MYVKLMEFNAIKKEGKYYNYSIIGYFINKY